MLPPAVFTYQERQLVGSFLLEAESIPGPGKFNLVKNPNGPIENQTRGHPVCSAMPKPTVQSRAL